MPTDIDFSAARPIEPVAARAASSERRTSSEPERDEGFAKTYQAVQAREPETRKPSATTGAPEQASPEPTPATPAPDERATTGITKPEGGSTETVAAAATKGQQQATNLQSGSPAANGTGVTPNTIAAIDPTVTASATQASAVGESTVQAADQSKPLAAAAAATGPASAVQASAAKAALPTASAAVPGKVQAASTASTASGAEGVVSAGDGEIEIDPAIEPKLVRARIDLASKNGANFGAAFAVEQGTSGSKQAGTATAATSSVGRSLEQNLLNLEASGRDGAQTKAAPDRGAAMIAAAPVETTTSTSFTGNGGETQAVQPTSNAQATQATAAAQAARAPQHQAQQPATQQVAVTISRAVRDGADRIEMQLHPAELGRVDVKMELGHDGRIMAVISAEKSETLESLRRDVHQLEKALADAGFDMNQGSFQFEENNQQQAGSGSSDGSGLEDEITPDPRLLEQAALANRMLALDGLGLDIRV